MQRYFVGADIGQAQDYSAISMLEFVLRKRRNVQGGWEPREVEITRDVYHVRHLERLPLKTPYPEIAERLARMFEHPRLASEGVLIVDATGVGKPVTDLLRQKGLWPVEVIITGGYNVGQHDYGYTVPKRDLVTALHTLVQGGRFKCSNKFEAAALLQEELQNFHYKIDRATGHESYEAWRESVHDDLVLSVAVAAWYATRIAVTPEVGADDEWEADEQVNREYDPLRQ
jgi:hypothetical protein